MSPINDGTHFADPRDRKSLDDRIFDFYVRNSHLRYLDTDEEPLRMDD